MSWLSHQNSQMKDIRASQGAHRENADTQGQLWKEVILTHRQQVSIGLQHHVPVQGPLSRVQEFPLLLSEFDGHILRGQSFLKWNHMSPKGPWKVLIFMQKRRVVRGKDLWDPPINMDFSSLFKIHEIYKDKPQHCFGYTEVSDIMFYPVSAIHDLDEAQHERCLQRWHSPWYF